MPHWKNFIGRKSPSEARDNPGKSSTPPTTVIKREDAESVTEEATSNRGPVGPTILITDESQGLVEPPQLLDAMTNPEDAPSFSSNGRNSQEPEAPTVVATNYTEEPVESLWKRAIEQLKSSNDAAHEYLTRLVDEEKTSIDSGKAICKACEDQIKLLQKDEMEVNFLGRQRKIRPFLRNISQVAMAFKDVVAPVARLDPHGGATMACMGVFAVFSVSTIRLFVNIIVHPGKVVVYERILSVYQ
jgi:hypothetical protein